MTLPIPNKPNWSSRVGLGTAIAGGVSLFIERTSTSHVKLQQIKIQNNQLKFDREKFLHQKRQNKTQNRLQQTEQISEIYKAEKRKEISSDQSKFLIEAIQTPIPVYPAPKIRDERQSSFNPKKPGLGLITLSNGKKKFVTEKNLNEDTSFQEIDDLSFNLLILPTVLGAFTGLLCYILMYRLWVWRNVILHKIKNLFM